MLVVNIKNARVVLSGSGNFRFTRRDSGVAKISFTKKTI
ncbi:MAG TPA: hypothetical protein DEB17_02910 [Chlorobaculum sp.]|uniref:Uncharacterized protein n=1 Tax=Chlorobaculum tepidum (strain ATCC 49652 / DSM 12025 / NBRC 103806 / TLS) TaxID=194439 RepID=Q8KEA5_CHLTE|nr:hypothetical protein CT0784 [Chlorobaculum tepidum TLS]HBU22940.1 hypothetical protein [Chlorobaculum sp.]